MATIKISGSPPTEDALEVEEDEDFGWESDTDFGLQFKGNESPDKTHPNKKDWRSKNVGKKFRIDMKAKKKKTSAPERFDYEIVVGSTVVDPAIIIK